MTSLDDLQARLKAALSPQRVAVLEEATNAARQLQLPLYLVGGAVRDLLMGRATTDLDLVVEGDAGALAKALASALAGEVLAHSQFGTARLRIMGQRIDVATARRETYRKPGALPTVHPGTISEDLERRDFTINAIALRLAPSPLHLLDPRDGQRDITLRLIHVLHPASFQDDATRILRAVRYEQRLEFRMEEETETLLRRDLPMLDTISGDRLRRELDLIFREERAWQMLQRAEELHVLTALYPPLPDEVRMFLRLDIPPLEGSPVQPLHYLALLAYFMVEEEREGFIRRLNMPAAWATVVRDAAQARQAAASLSTETSPAVAYRLLHPLSLPAVQVAAALAPSKQAQHNLERYVQEWRHVRPLLNGRDLIRLGVPPGPQVGALLAALRDARLEGRIRTRREEEAFVRERIATPTS